MPVLEQVTEQITEAADRFFDAAESANDRAHDATKSLVTRVQDGDLPFADRLPEVNIADINLPLVDKLPEPLEAVDAYFGFMSKGIKTNRELSEKLMNRIASAPAVIDVPAKKAPAKKSTASKTATKATAKKPAAKK